MVTSPVQIGVSARALQRDALELRGIFETVDENSCPGKLNFHMHTHHSDGQLSVENLIEQAIRLGLREFAITDHHTVSGFRRAKQARKQGQIVFLIRHFFLSEKRGNPYASLRINTWQSGRTAFSLQLVKGANRGRVSLPYAAVAEDHGLYN